jgi:hypothetical protein
VAPAVITSHALKYGLVSPYTSMVAIGDEVVVQGGVKRSVAIPVSVPAGMKWQMVKKETTVDKTVDNREHDTTKRPAVTKQQEPTKIDRGYTKNLPKPAPAKDAKRRPDTKPVAKKPPDRPERATKDSPAPPPPVSPTTPYVGGADKGDADEQSKKTAKKKRADEDDAADGEGASERTFELDARAPAPARSIAATGTIDVLGEAIEVTGSRKRWRLATSFAGGFARSGGESVSLLSAGARLELAIAPRVMSGFDASLSVYDGDVVRGQGLVSFAVLGIKRWLELGFGFGLSFGELGTGPATGVSLRFHLPPKPRASLFLRYDGALIYDNDTRRGQSSGTVGIEWGF